MSRTQKSRTGTASKKKVSPEQKASSKKYAPEKNAPEKNAPEKNESEKSQDSKRSSDFGYDSLARQTLDLWREQLSHFLNNPDAMSDINKVMEPAAKMMPPQISQMFTPLFSGGMDIWLMMLEQLGKAANMNTKGATETSPSEKNNEQKTAQSTSSQSRTQDRATTASALSGASAYAVAQLASRLADLEKRFAEFAKSSQSEGTGKPVAKKPSRKKKTTPSVVAAVKRAKQQA